MIMEIKQDINFSQFLDNILAELSSKTLTRQEADDYSEKIIDEIEEEYNLFGAEGFPKLAEKHIVQKISNVLVYCYLMVLMSIQTVIKMP